MDIHVVPQSDAQDQVIEYAVVTKIRPDSSGSGYYGFGMVLGPDGRETGEQVYFNRNYGRLPVHNGSGVCFSNKKSGSRWSRTFRTAPQPGDKIAFRRVAAATINKQNVAKPWVPARIWEETRGQPKLSAANA